MSIRTTLIRLLAVMASAWAICGVAQAEISQGNLGERLERLRQMSPDERQRVQAEWKSLAPEQQLEKRRELGSHLAAMTPEQRQQMRQQMREHWQQAPPDGERRQWREQRQLQRDERQQWREQRPLPREDRPQRGDGRGWRGR